MSVTKIIPQKVFPMGLKSGFSQEQNTRQVDPGLQDVKFWTWEFFANAKNTNSGDDNFLTPKQYRHNITRLRILWHKATARMPQDTA